jgi:hypothetical protein
MRHDLSQVDIALHIQAGMLAVLLRHGVALAHARAPSFFAIAQPCNVAFVFLAAAGAGVTSRAQCSTVSG